MSETVRDQANALRKQIKSADAAISKQQARKAELRVKLDQIELQCNGHKWDKGKPILGGVIKECERCGLQQKKIVG